MQWPYFQLLCNLKNPFVKFLKQQGVISLRRNKGEKDGGQKRKKNRTIEKQRHRQRGEKKRDLLVY